MTHGESTDLAITPVPVSSRMSKVALTMAWWSICSAMFYVFVAAELAARYGTLNAIGGMVLAVPCFTLLAGVITKESMRTGRGSFLMARVLFGAYGQLVATLVFFSTAVYYAVFEGAVVATAASKVIPGLSYGFASVIVVIYSVCLIGGSMQRWFDRLNGVLLPVYLGGLLLTVILSVRLHGYPAGWLDRGSEPAIGLPGVWHCFVAYLGLLGLILSTADFARFGKAKDVGYHKSFTFGMPFYLVAFVLNGLAGIFIVAATRLPQVTETAVVDASLQILGGAAGLLFIWASQTRINSANYYLSTVNMQAFVLQSTNRLLPRMLSAVIIGVFVLVLMLATDVLKYILAALALQAVVLTAWIGVAIAHVLALRTSPDERRLADQAPRLNHKGLSAWAAGTAAGLAFLWVIPGAASLSAPVTFVVSFVIYAFGSLVRPQAAAVVTHGDQAG